MNQDLLNEISAACREDKRLRDILRRVLSMNDKEMLEFKKKMNIYFIGRYSQEDLEVKHFFSFILKNNGGEEPSLTDSFSKNLIFEDSTSAMPCFSSSRNC